MAMWQAGCGRKLRTTGNRNELKKKTVLKLNIHINTKSKARAKNSNTSKLQGDTEQGDARPWGTIWQGKRTDSNNRFKITKGKVAGGSIAEDTCTSRILGTIRWCWCFPDLCVYVCVCRSKWKFCYKEFNSHIRNLSLFTDQASWKREGSVRCFFYKVVSAPPPRLGSHLTVLIIGLHCKICRETTLTSAVSS